MKNEFSSNTNTGHHQTYSVFSGKMTTSSTGLFNANIRYTLLAVMMWFFTFPGYGQLLQWNTFGNTGTETMESSVFNATGVAAADWTHGAGVSPSSNANRFGGDNWFDTGNTNPTTLAEAIADEDYLTFTITPDGDYMFTPTELSFVWGRSGTGASDVTLRSSADGFTADLGTVSGIPDNSFATQTIAITGLTDLTTATEFRLYGYGASGTTGSGGFDVNADVVNVELDGTTSCKVRNVNTSVVYCTLQDAIDNALTGHVIELLADITEGLVQVNNELTIDGQGFTLTSTSATYGIEVLGPNVTIQDITVEDAGGFGIHASCGTHALALTNLTVDNSGGTGVTINGSDNVVITNLTSTNNLGNGISLTNCDNTSIVGITTSGNAFAGGFNAGIGLFTTDDYCLPAEINGFSLTGTVSIAEDTKVYSQKENASETITGISGSTILWAVGIAAQDRSYWPDKPTAYAVVDALFEPPFNYPNTAVYVAEVATEDFYVDDDPAGDATPPMLIQTAINFQVAGGKVFLETGTFNERVTINKSLTLDGAGEGASILDGTGLTAPSTGSGITLASGITDITIQDMTVANFDGITPNTSGGIYGVAGNDNLTILNVDLADNIGGSGFYANGPIDNVMINNVDAHGHTNVNGAARGIVIWNGHKSNITITNCEVYDNNCCGIELQDGSSSGVNISNNYVHDNWDNGIGIVAMDGTTGANLVDDNDVYDNGRFGIEIKNPNGDGANIVVSNNDVQQTSSFSGLRPAELRDIAGIAVFRRALTGSNVDVPTGVTVSSNSVSGYEQDNGASSSEGFGIVIEGTNHTVTGNTINNNDVGLQQQAGHLPYPGDGNQNDLADTYFGRGNSPMTCSNTLSSNTFSGNGSDSRDIGVGGGTVTNFNTSETFCTIQGAIDATNTLAGHTILVSAGSYYENVVVTKGVTIQGAGIDMTYVYPATSDPNCGGGGGGSLCPGASNVFLVEADDVIISEMTIDGDNPSLTSGVVVNGADVDARNGIISNYNAGTFNNMNVNNVKVQNIYLRGIYAASGGTFTFTTNQVINVAGEAASIGMFNFGGAGAFTDNNVSQCSDGIASNWSKGSTYTGNIVTDCSSGIHSDNNSAGVADVISDNTISNGAGSSSYGIFVFNPYHDVQVSDNTITNVHVGMACTGSLSATPTITFSGNTIDASSLASSTGMYPTNEVWGYGAGDATIIFENNFVSNTTDDAFYVETTSPYTLDFTANNNSITNHISGVNIVGTGTLVEDFQCNWWGAPDAASVDAAAASSSNYTPWLVDGTDDAPGTPGFQPVAGACSGEPVVINSAVSSYATCGAADGSILVTFSGGTAPHDVSWTGPSSGTDLGATSPHTITGLVAGVYTVTVTDNNGSTATAMSTVELYPVKNTNGPTYHATIQDGINAAAPGDILEVCAGTYTEALTINIDLTIKGPNTGIPGTGVRVGEAILEDGSISVTGSPTVVIDGFHVHQTNNTLDVILLSGGSATTVENCIIEREAIDPGIFARAIVTSSGAGVKTIQNNLFTGDDSGGLFGSHLTWNSGMYVNGAASTVNILNNTFNNCRTALNLDDFNNGISLVGNSLDNCGTFLAFGGTSPTNGQYVLGANDFNTPGSAHVNLSNVDPAFRLDITSSTLAGAAFNTYPLATLFLVEQGMYHRGRAGRNGLVYYVANNQYVVPGQTTIQSAVDYAATNDIINLNTGTFNENVTVDLPVTIDGETGLCGDVVIDGGGALLFGVKILSNVQNVTLKDFKIQNTVGTNGGVWGGNGNHGLMIDNLCLENTSGQGAIIAHGPVNGVTITNCEVSGAGVNGRGIVIWDGLKENVTITGNHVHDISGCCGIELQDGSATGATVTGNTVTNTGDSGMAAVGLTGPGNNAISGNTVTNTGRFGIEIKNPDGDGANTLVDNNMVSLTLPFSTLKPTENRDIGGIVIIRRSLTGSNVDVPTGVQVTNNTVSGYIQDNAASSSEGFGIVIEGTNHTVTGNTINNNDVGIQQQAGHLPYPGDGNQNDLADTYFGRGNSPMTCSNTLSSNTFSGNGTDTRNVSVGGGLVTNTTTLETFCSIQSAIDDPDTDTGHTLDIDPGTYNENVVVNKQLTLNGSGNGSDPLTNTVLTPSASCAGTGLTISADNVTIQNIYMTDYQDAVALSSVANPVIDNMVLEDYCRYGIRINGSLNTNVAITNTTVQRTSTLAGTVGIRAGTADGVNGLLIEDCTVNGNILGMYFAQSSSPSLFTNIVIQSSTISNNTQKGMYFEKLDNALLQELTMDNNGTDPLYANNNGIDINLKFDDYENITILNCDITNSGAVGSAADPEHPSAIAIKARDDGGTYGPNPATLTNVIVQNNLITGPQNGLRFGESGQVNAGPSNVTVEGNDLSYAFAHKALIRRTDDDVNVVCNWHGSTSLPVILATFADAGTGSTILSSILTSGGDSNPGDVGFQPAGSCGCASGNLVTNIFSTETFCTIQAAIDDADTDPGDVIVVGPGTYIEYLYLHKAIDLRGNNYGVNPNTDVRGSESIIIPYSSDPDYLTGSSIIYIGDAANGSSIDGFTIDGDNPDLTSPMDINGANIDAVSAVAMYGGAGSLTISNNIAKNVSYSGIELASYPLSLPISTDNQITNNLIDNVGGSPFGIGVIVHYNAYTQIENNVISQVRAGVQTGNFTKVNTGAAATISNNDITSSRRSIFYNVMYNGSSPFTIANNTLTAETGSLNSWGLTLGTLDPNITVDILDNTITGHQVGVDFWNNLATTPVTITGGSITNCQVGARANNYDGYNSNAGSASVAMSGVSISACDTAVWVKDNPLNSNNATITLTLMDDCEISNTGQTEKGILVTGPDATVIVQDNDASIHGFAIGIDVNGGNATVTNNHIYDNGIGIRFINGGNGDANTNNFFDALPNGTDIEVAVDAGAVSATPDNWFAGSSFGVNNASALSVDATQCYWNDPSGPGPVGPGTGANVSANVLWCPWLGDVPVPHGGTGLPESSPTVTIEVTETSGTTDDDGVICDGDAVLLDATTTGAVSYLWSTTETTPTINVSPSSTTNYSVTVTFAGCTDDESVTITVNPVPVVSGPTEVCVGFTIQMLPSTGGTWTSSDDLIATIGNDGVVTGVAPGVATFTYTDNVTGCFSTSAPVTVHPVPDATITAPEFAWENLDDNYTASVPDAGVGATYNWSLSSGSIVMGGGTNEITIMTGAAGTLTVNVTVTDNNACSSVGTADIEVLPECLMIDFSQPVLLSETPALGYWYKDRKSPNIFAAQASAPDATPNTLHHGINASDGDGVGFYNTQGRKHDLYPGTQAIQVDLFIPASWATTNRRMAGMWGTAEDAGDAISAYPIIEFSSDGGTPRFRIWESGTGTWVDLGLPSGFVYDSWVTLRSQLLASGEFLHTIITDQGVLQYETTTSAADASVELVNVILQGHNTTAGVTYDIHWDNFKSSSIPAPEITAPAEVCAGTSGHMASVTPVGGATYAWSISDGSIDVGDGTSDIEFTAGTDSEISLSVTITTADCEVTVTTIVAVNPLPSAVITTAPTVVEATPNNPATIPDAGGGATYAWTIVNGTITNGLGTSSILYTAGVPGILTLEVTVTDANGCVSTGTIDVNVIPAGTSSMQWVPDDAAHGSCGETTDCCADIICFGLEYTPGVTGDLTSYTTGFKANCLGTFPSGITPISSNMSCVMTDNSFEIDGCAAIDSVLFNSSGNSGLVPVVAGTPIILHKVCFELPAGEVIGVVEDAITDLSASVDLSGGGQYTEYPDYTTTNLSKTLPVIPPNGSQTVSCPNEAVMPVPPLVFDYCGNTVNAVWNSTVESPEPLDCEGTRTYHFTYTDCANEDYPWSFTYTVNYTGGLEGPSGTSSTVTCPDDAVDPGPPVSIFDACGRTVVPGLIGSTEIPDSVTCNGTVVWTYRYTACDGVTTDNWTHTYTILYDGGLNAPADETETISCPEDAVDPGPPATIFDACDRTVVPGLIGSTESPDPGTCNGTVVWTYRYTACDGTTTDDWTYTYTIDYSGGLTAPALETETVSCPDQVMNPGPPAAIFDACDRTVTPGFIGIEETPNPVTCNGTVVYRYRYTACDLTTTVDWTKTFTVTYNGGLTAPANTSSTVECAADAVDPGPPAVISDACGRTVSPGLIGSTDIPNPVTCNGTIIWTYRYTACDETTIADWTHTYTINRVTDPTEVGGPAETSSTIDCPDDAVPPALPVIVDVCGTTLSPDGAPVIGGTNTGGCTGTITYTYTYTDCANLQFVWVYTYTVECNALNLRVFLEGPYNTSTDLMENDLNINHVLPGQDKLLSPNPGIQLGAPFTPFGQPYNTAPWNYNGNTGLNFGDPTAPGAPPGVIPYPPDVVDWILVTIRKNGILPANNIWSCAGWVHTDGTISFPESCGAIGVDPIDDHYVLVQHRNHLGVLSPMPMDELCGGITMEWDFTTDNSYQPIFRYGQTEVEPGVWAMLKANGEQISSINAISSPDRTTWRVLQNALGYSIGDYNMNASTTSGDETDWKNNQNKTSGIIFY